MDRSQTFYPTIAANATEQPFTPTFYDKALAQSFKGVFVGITTAGVMITIYYGGKKIAQFDCSIFASSHRFAYFDLLVPPNQQLTYSFTDLSGAGAANVPVTFKYSIPTNSDGTTG